MPGGTVFVAALISILLFPQRQPAAGEFREGKWCQPSTGLLGTMCSPLHGYHCLQPGPGAGTSGYRGSLCLCCTCLACRAVPQLPLICPSTAALVVINVWRPAALKVIAKVVSNPSPSMIFCCHLELGLKCGFGAERCSCMGSSFVPHCVSSQFSPVSQC